jgi:hypothetical protein
LEQSYAAGRNQKREVLTADHSSSIGAILYVVHEFEEIEEEVHFDTGPDLLPTFAAF